MPTRRPAPKPAAPPASRFEKLGAFYLGRLLDPKTGRPAPEPLLYDSRDLVTHAVCVGMTGSGKTGLCLSLLEEAAIDGIPAIVLDPKGDLPNLLLTFPDLRPEDFEPWINEEDARRKGLSAGEYAAQQAELWRQGLAEWGQDGERIRRLREGVDMAVYTPASNAGLPVSILSSFAAPDPGALEDTEYLRDRIGTTAAGLLGLLGIDADPLKSREHILVSKILETAWTAGQDLDLGALVQQIQQPPVGRIGVMDLESFYPAKERFELAMAVNNLLAAPGFEAWLEGDPLDVGAMLRTAEGKPRLSIFSIAHLNDAERMFFVSLLLNQVLGWTRAQSGTTSLRAILYMDEIFGFFPPVGNPPSKTPLLTLLKQARAFGVGVVLATQNPVDLDYKGLSNAGTWFIGRLQTERDKARMIEGLEGSAARGFDRGEMERLIAGLKSRVFVMNNVHEDEPVVFETRWAMSYLRGPLTRAEIKLLMEPRRAAGPAERPAARASPRAAAVAGTGGPPVLPPQIDQYFVPARTRGGQGASLVYLPSLFGTAQVRFVDARASLDLARGVAYLAPLAGGPVPADWEAALLAEVGLEDLEREPLEGSSFGDLPPAAARAASYGKWSRDFAAFLARSLTVDLLFSPGFKRYAEPGEAEREFRARLQQEAREGRDAAVEGLRDTYARKASALQERLRNAQQAVEREAEQAREAKMQTAVSVGATLLGAFLGRKKLSTGTIGRATTAARGVGRSARQAQDVGRAREDAAALQAQLEALEAELEREAEALTSSLDPLAEELQTVSIRPKKTNIEVRLVVLAWAPYWQEAGGPAEPAWEGRAPARAARTGRIETLATRDPSE